MASQPKLIVNRLFVAAPELAFDIDFVEALRLAGYLDDNDVDNIKEFRRQSRRLKRTYRRMRNRTLMQRLLLVTPEIISVESVNLLRRYNLIDDETGHKWRLLSRALSRATTGGLPSSNQELLLRLARTASTGLSFEAIDLMRVQGRISIEQANDLRAALLAGQVGGRAARKAQQREAGTIMQMLFMALPDLIDKDLVRAMTLVGLIDRKTAAVLNVLIDIGPGVWRTVTGMKAAEGYAERLLLAASGFLSHEMVNAMLELKLITPTQARYLRPAVTYGREFARDLIETNITKPRRYRVLPGESPIQAFARTSRYTDRQILSLLAKAAQESRVEAEALLSKQGIGRSVRSAQYRIQARAMHETMREMWENVGYLVIKGETDAARQAVEAMDMLQNNIWRHGGKRLSDLRQVLRQQARAGVDSYISRRENVIALSRMVYRNRDLALGRVDQRIALGLLRGQSAAEIAKDVARFIRPDVPGGVSYAAMRLARTEISNAFHWTSIRYTREQPWVQGYKWNLSGSHPIPDICNEMAEKDHDDMGPGVYKKSHVPGKPHPHCFCYVTTVTVDEAQFLRGMQRGYYDQWIKQARKGGLFDISDPGDLTGEASIA